MLRVYSCLVQNVSMSLGKGAREAIVLPHLLRFELTALCHFSILNGNFFVKSLMLMCLRNYLMQPIIHFTEEINVSEVAGHGSRL